MRYDSVEDWIRTENERDDSVDDQVIVGTWIYENAYTTVSEKQIRTQKLKEEIEDELEYTLETILSNLLEIGVVEVITPPGAPSYIKHERTGDAIFGVFEKESEILSLLEEEVSRLLEDVRKQDPPRLVAPTTNSGVIDPEDELISLREVVAESLGITPDQVETVLTTEEGKREDLDDLLDRMQQFETAVKAIKASEVVSREGDYDEMGWRNRANRWALSERATIVEDRKRS